jgi:hypothetical protein
MLFKNKKGQGALEYLLLIGGAVLIAVIVIALLVGMGGQSRDTAQDASDKAQQATDVPQPAQIVSVTALRAECDPTADSNITVNWRPLGEGGSYDLHILDSSNDIIYESLDLNPNELSLAIEGIDLGGASCGDSYYVKIITTKNNQSVTSQSYRFSWTQ